MLIHMKENPYSYNLTAGNILTYNIFIINELREKLLFGTVNAL